MSDVKWIKITVDMFDNRKIKHLRRLPNGDSIVLIWVMLLTLAGRCNAGGMVFLTENIPYTPTMLANELGFEESTVILALKSFEELGMVSTTDNSFLRVDGWEEHQNIEGLDKIREQTRKRVAKCRENQRLLSGNVTSNATVTQCNEADIDIDKEIDISESNTGKPPVSCVDFEKFWSAYPKKIGKKSAKKAFYRAKVPVETLLTAIERQKCSNQWSKDNGQFIPNPTTWLNQGRWDDELVPSTPVSSPQDSPDGFALVSDGHGGIMWQSKN